MLGAGDHGALLLQDQSEDVRRRLASMQLQNRLEGSADEKREAKLRGASQDFEAIFIHQMLKQMRATVPKEGLLHSRDEEFWQSHFDGEMAVIMARQGGIGLGDIIFEQLKETQVKASQSTTPPAEDMPVMTLLEPFHPPKPPEKKDQPESRDDDELAKIAEQLAGDGDPDLVYIPGVTGVMGQVRSLARAIEERGGVVPEHPGALDSGIGPVRDMTSSTGLPPMHWPVQARVSSGFGWRKDPFTGERAWHSGVDFAAPQGSPVQAAWDGRVVFNGERGGYGRMVVLEHEGGWRTYYAHNNENTVKVGDQVHAGQTIATVGSSGRSTGPHLHFEIRQGNLAWNPKQIRDRLLAGLPIGREESA